MNLFRLKSCIKCGGDLALEDGDWICLQCGTYYYTGLYRPRPGVANPGLPGDRPPAPPRTNPDSRPGGGTVDRSLGVAPTW